MICSHEKKFVFIKTMRTAGTSIELALAPFLEQSDVLSSGSLVHDKGYERRNHRKTNIKYYGHNDLNVFYSGLLTDIIKGYKGRWKRPFFIRQHASAREVHRYLGEKKWSGYFTCCIERNPWDRMVSYYKYRMDSHDLNIDFKDWLYTALEGSKTQRIKWAADNVRNHPLYSHKGKILVDKIYRFEDLPESFDTICNYLGLSSKNLLSHVNRSSRNQTAYRDYYDRESRLLVKNALSIEVETGRYKF